MATVASALLLFLAWLFGRAAISKSLPFQIAAAAAQVVAAAAPLALVAGYLIPVSDGAGTVILVCLLGAASAFGTFAARHIAYGSKFAALLLGTVALIALTQLGTMSALAAGAAILMGGWLLADLAEFSADEIAARRIFERRQSAERAATQRALTEFERFGTDWLFALDAHGHLVDVSERFAEEMNRTASDLEGKSFIALFDETHVRHRLAERIAQRTAFRNVVLALQIKGEPHHWRLNGMPVDENKVAIRGLISDLTAQRNAEARVNRIAMYDALTDLPNRSLFEEEAETALGSVTPENRVALFLLDIDRLKEVNDNYGHRAGDTLLKTTARRLRALVRQGDVLSRYGGNQFAVMLTGGFSAERIESFANTLVQELAQPISHDGLSIDTSVSVGLALSPEDSRTLTRLLKRSDLALHHAKQSGGSCWRRFDAEMAAADKHRKLLDSEMKQALKRGEFQLFYQPLVSAGSLDLKGFEALIRWISPTRGFVSPGEFIAIAEESGFIEDLGEWVVRTAIAQAAKWPDHINVAINISPAQLRNDQTERAILEMLDKTRIEASRIELEITEGVLLKEDGRHMSMLKRLRARGIRFSLDDFGTGFSSLSYLRTFPFHKIKIDRSFVNDMGEKNSQAIIRTILNLARDMNMTSVAEGVELPGQLAALQHLGCDQIQGYLTGRPLPVAEANRTVEESVFKRQQARARLGGKKSARARADAGL